MAAPVIYDSTGVPMRVSPKALSSESSVSTVRQLSKPFDGSVASGLKPQALPGILSRASEGDFEDFITLAEEMEEREPHYMSVLGTRKRAVSSIAMTIEAGTTSDSDREIAAACKALIDQPDFIDMLDDALDGLGKGFSVIEMVWDTSSTPWMPRDFIWQDQRHFQFDKIHRRRLRQRSDDHEEGLALQPGKFITHMPKLKSGKPIRAALARVAVWSFVLKSYTIKDWASFCETFGMPIRIGKFHPSASDEDKKSLMRALVGIASDAAGIVSQNADIELVQAQVRGGEAVFGQFARYLDEQVSKIILGQTMTADNGSSKSQAEVHNEVRLDIKQADARNLEATINKDIIRPFVDINFGRQQRYPHCSLPVTEPEDLDLLSQVVERLVPLGLEVSAAEVRERIGFSAPGEKDVLLSAVQTNAATVPIEKGLNTRQSADELLNEIGVDEQANWEDQMDPLLAPIRKLVAEAGSYAEILDGLEHMSDRMDDAELAASLYRARMKARGVGDQVD
ncbi:phage protein [Roseibium sp. TrichSKD4]|uniref:DUF935 domain-containing protein n=1 Tax=Roseibium sp. TrichSKD4 TaxID=744980 RepID=UPI0001E57609|nr:DUF935 domain-containing protein [Roseibium sp. TrichSKD4]EFO30944.1 phage protein [Roseibium sp. TrichSKD4]